jgi:predicted RNA-binding protein Jag
MEKSRDRSAISPASSPRGSFHPPIPPESLLAQWRELLGWDDLAWEFHPVENKRLPVDLKTSRGETLAGSGGKVLEAFEYLFNLVSSGGDREKPWVSFRVAGFPSADESRLVDQALFAAFQVRRTGKIFRMDPMPPAHRRAVHQTLAHHPDVETFSEGEGPLRLVVVKPKEKKE